MRRAFSVATLGVLLGGCLIATATHSIASAASIDKAAPYQMSALPEYDWMAMIIPLFAATISHTLHSGMMARLAATFCYTMLGLILLFTPQVSAVIASLPWDTDCGPVVGMASAMECIAANDVLFGGTVMAIISTLIGVFLPLAVGAVVVHAIAILVGSITRTA